MSKGKKIIVSLSICSMIFFISMISFVYLNYIDISVIKTIYLPIYLIIFMAILFKRFIFAYIFTISAVIGLITEYLIQESQTRPNMKAAFSNTTIVFMGAIIGVVMQLYFSRRIER